MSTVERRRKQTDGITGHIQPNNDGDDDADDDEMMR